MAAVLGRTYDSVQGRRATLHKKGLMTEYRLAALESVAGSAASVAQSSRGSSAPAVIEASLHDARSNTNHINCTKENHHDRHQ